MVDAVDRAVAKAAASAFGGEPRVHRHYDVDETNAVDILTCADRPSPGFVTYSTLGLRHFENVLDDADIRVELAGVCSIGASEFPNLLATAAFFVMKQHWLCGPGVVFPGILNYYALSRDLEHILWVEPFPWEQLGAVTLPDRSKVHWLLAIPIAESERQFLLAEGYYALEALFSSRDLPYFDLGRTPVV